MKKLLTILLVTMSTFSFSQERTITGTVTDPDGLPVVGVTVMVEGTKSGTTTDFDGNYSIKASPENILVFTYIGMETQRITVRDQKIINVQLTESSEQLDEVVVVGYGTVKKGDVTGAVSSVKSEEITKVGAVSLDQALAGRAAGVVVSQSSGQPGSGSAIRIRSVSSLNGSDPLYVIDGVPLDNSSPSGLGDQDTESSSINPLSMINPSDIESVEILKDASSTAIFGSRGANGVILITTKQGRSGKGIITIEQDYGLMEVPKFIDVLKSNEYYILNREAYTNAGNLLDEEMMVKLDSARAGQLENNDWQKSIIRTGIQSNTNLSFSGGNEAVKYLISSNLLDSKGIIDQTNYRRASTRVNLNANMTDNLKVGLTMNYSHVNSDQRAINTGLNNLRGATSAISRALRAAPTTGLLAEDEDDGIELWTPITAIEANEYTNLLTQFIGSMHAEYSFSDAISFKTLFTYQNRNTAQRYYQYNILPNNVAEGGRAKTGDSRFTNYSITNTLNFKKRYGKHSINVLLGQAIEANESESVNVSNYGFANDLLTYYNPGSATFYDPDRVTYSDQKLASFFGRIDYNFKGKYLLTITGRYDGSSKFATNNKWAFFPAAAIAYKISNEKFLKDIEDINEIKLRLSYGSSGNQALSPYQSLDQYASGLVGINEVTNTTFYQSQLPNPNLTWETTTQLDVGLDYGLFKNRLIGSFEYYKKTTDDLLFAGNRVPVQAGQSTYTENFGSLETNGFEATITAQIINNEKTSWTLNANLATGKTKVKNMASDYLFSGWNPGFISGGTQRLIIGDEIGAFYGYKRTGIAQFDDFIEFQGLTPQEQIEIYNANPSATYTFVPDFNGGVPESDARPGEQLYEDVTPDGALTADDRRVIGYAQPDITFGINNSFTFGNLDFSFFIDSQLGKDLANLQNIKLLDFSGRQGLALTINRWTPENPSTQWPRLNQDNNNSKLFSDRYIEDASFVRLQNVTIGYNFPKEVTDKFLISGLRLYISGSNLALWTKYTGFNPDVSARGSSTVNLGHDNGGYPSARLIRMGLNVKF